MTRAPLLTESLGSECREHFKSVISYLETVGTSYSVNSRMVRGLDYYVKTAFEVVSYDLGAQNAVAGGGRYDGLIADLGGPEIPGIGFAIGMERLISLLPPSAGLQESTRLFIAAMGAKPRTEALKVANSLRLENLRVEIGHEQKTLKSLMRRADKLGCRYVLILGEEELNKGSAILRDMGTKTQEEVALGQALEVLTEKMK